MLVCGRFVFSGTWYGIGKYEFQKSMDGILIASRTSQELYKDIEIKGKKESLPIKTAFRNSTISLFKKRNKSYMIITQVYKLFCPIRFKSKISSSSND